MRPPFHALPSVSFSRLRILSERPPILLAPNLLSCEECHRLREKASARPLGAQSFDEAQGSGKRTSSGCVMRDDEVPTIRKRFADLAGVALSQLQPLKVSRYVAGQRFDIHTDAWRGDLRGQPAADDDYWADRQRAEHGVPGAPIRGVNRMLTIFVYLSDVTRGGRTRWRWTDHDRALGGTLGGSFYDAPTPGSGRTDVKAGSGDEVAVQPEMGLGVLHFPSTSAEHGGVTDYNAYHEAEPPIEPPEKWILQSFIWTHPKLDWARVLEEENLPPMERRTADVI